MGDTLSIPSGIVPLPYSLPDWVDRSRVDTINRILKMGNVSVCKTTRAGATTSAIIAAHMNGLKVLVVSPTRKIGLSTVRDTVERLGGVCINVPGNQSCRYVKDKIRKDRFLRNLPIPKEKCSECNHFETCPVTEIERVENFTVVTMTYAKLHAITMNEKEFAKFVELLKHIDLVLFDEAHVISYQSLPEVELDKHVTTPEGEFHAIRGVYKRFCDLRNGYLESADNIKKQTELNPDRYTGFHIDIPDQTNPQVLHLQLDQLLKVAETRMMHWARDEANDQVLALKNIISIMASPSATISYKKAGNAEKMIITSGRGDLERAITRFLTWIVPEAKVCFLSGTMIERRPGLFADLVSREVTNVIFPDLCNTNAKMHIHPSKWKFSASDANNGIERAIKEISEINEKVGRQPIYLIGLNEYIKDQLMKGLKGCTNIHSDYYRSEDSMGVERSERIAIAVGLAHTPRHTCDPLAQGADDNERYLDSQQLRRNEVHAATWQAWSRVKDPKGEVESHVYCIGIRADEISDVVTWGTNRTIKASTDGNGKLDWKVEVDQELDRPIVYGEERTSKGLSRHDIREYIDKVQPIKFLIDHRMNSQESILSPYNNNNNCRENVDIFGNSESLSIYKSPSNPDEQEATSFALRTLFAGRPDCYATRSKKPGKDGKYGFRKKDITTDVPSIIKGHLNGSETIGFYPFDTDDQCYYCAFDIQERDNAMKLSKFLLDNDLPVLVEKLVPQESFHIWMPIISTKTLTVHKFGKQLLHDAGVKGADVYPRQKSIGSCHKGSCGDFLTLPLGIDQEKKKISEFIDPRTFESVGSVDIDKVIRLREAPESKTVKPPEEDDQG